MTAAVFLLERLGAYVLTWSWQMAVLVLFAWIAVSMDRRHRPTLRHRIWVLTLAVGLVLPWISARIAAQSLTQEVRQVLMPPIAESRKPEAQAATGIFLAPAAVAGKTQATSVARAGNIAPSRWNVSRTTLLQAIGLLWAAGAAVAAFRRMRAYWRLRRVARSARRAEAEACVPPILLSPDVRSPMLYGWFHPVILLPENVSNWSTPEERATMIRHESVHYARKDHWIAAFEALVRTVFFFHPLVRWVCGQIDIERELACDEEVLRRGADPETYAEAILKVAEHAFAGTTHGVYFSGTGQLDQRVDLLFRKPVRVARSAALLLPVLLPLAPTIALGFWQAPVEALAPISFRLEVNPLRVLPEEVFAPTPTPIVAEAPRPARSQDQPVNPAAAPEPLPVMRVDVAFMKITEGEVMTKVTLGLPYSLLTFKEALQGRSRKATGYVQGQVTNIAGQILAPIDETFEMEFPGVGFNPAGMAVFQKTLFLRPGL